jgi:hypothetical protein
MSRPLQDSSSTSSIPEGINRRAACEDSSRERTADMMPPRRHSTAAICGWVPTRRRSEHAPER